MSHSELCRLACDAWNEPRLDNNIPPQRDIVLLPPSLWCGGTRPSSPHAASLGGCFGRRVLHEFSDNGFGRYVSE